MNARTQITMEPELQILAHAKAAELGISFAEYVRRLVAQDLAGSERKVRVSAVFDLVDEGPPTHIAREKKKMLAEAVWEEHLRSTGARRSQSRAKPRRR
jgi:hypothetical protein